MIQFTGYFRDETDKAKWKQIPNKVAWLHRALNQDSHDGIFQVMQPTGESVKRTKSNVGEIPTSSTIKDMKFCKHGSAIGFCKYGCKKWII